MSMGFIERDNSITLKDGFTLFYTLRLPRDFSPDKNYLLQIIHSPIKTAGETSSIQIIPRIKSTFDTDKTQTALAEILSTSRKLLPVGKVVGLD